ncbi:hypothetical protein G7Z17_g4746 [Cylindrodendrum hubeiense]|uniref:Uncharacterized protein n=1 Tax=Cylindrodendrum hubeiense TaxID=595255 RepID=A0A9P5LCD2_9HYPO|nr:hypothetical protein G7Z17_g4746 [Cylindrodendrum hubeiense]
MHLIARGAGVDGRFLYVDSDTIVIAPADSALRTLFQFDRANRLLAVDGGSTGKAVLQIVVSQYLLLRTLSEVSKSPDYHLVRCKVDPDTFELTCQSRTSTLHPWYFSNGDTSPNGSFLWLKAFASDDIQIRIFAIPVGCLE